MDISFPPASTNATHPSKPQEGLSGESSHALSCWQYSCREAGPAPHFNLLLYLLMEKQYTDDFFFDLISRCALLSRLLREPATSTIPSE